MYCKLIFKALIELIEYEKFSFLILLYYLRSKYFMCILAFKKHISNQYINISVNI